MSKVQIRLRDRVFARMLEILLLENKISVEVTDKKEARLPDGCELIITDPFSADRETVRFSRTVYILHKGETAPEGSLSFTRPFLLESFVSEILDMLLSEEKPKESAPPALSIDKRHRTARYGKTVISLTDKEFSLLSLLFENRGRTVTNEEIVERVFEGKTVEGSNISAVYINYLRKKLDEKLGKRFIYAVRGKGYSLRA